MTARTFSRRLMARRLGGGVMPRSEAWAARQLRRRSVAVSEARVFLRAFRPLAPSALRSGAPGDIHVVRLSSATREILREVHRPEIRAAISTPVSTLFLVSERARASESRFTRAAISTPVSTPFLVSERARVVERRKVRAPSPAVGSALPRPWIRGGMKAVPLARSPAFAMANGGSPVVVARAARAARVEHRPRASTPTWVQRDVITSRSWMIHALCERIQIASSTFAPRERATVEPRPTASVLVRSPGAALPGLGVSNQTVFLSAPALSASPAPPVRSALSIAPSHRAQLGGAAPARAFAPSARGPERISALSVRRRALETPVSRIEPRFPRKGPMASLREAEPLRAPRAADSSPGQVFAVPRPTTARPTAPGLEYARPKPSAAASTPIEETLRRQVEEKVERRIVERVETVVARELAPDSIYSRRLSERVQAGIYDSLVLERERMGWR